MKTKNALAAAALAGALVIGTAGCGSEEQTAAADGWRTLETPGITVAYPDGWKKQSASERGKHTQGAAVLVKDGRTIGKVAVQLDFMSSGDAKMAAAGALGSIELGGRVRGQEKVTVPGTDDAQRIDYTQTGDGKPGNPPEGAEIRGIDIVGVDGNDAPFLVRINATSQALGRAELEKIAESVQVERS